MQYRSSEKGSARAARNDNNETKEMEDEWTEERIWQMIKVDGKISKAAVRSLCVMLGRKRIKKSGPG